MSAAEARLSALSPKVAVPFRKLLDAGQLNEDILKTVLDAGELAGDTSKLLAFATGMLYLQSQGVPVKDVVQMAKEQRRRVNLAWSAKRWREEHDRLSQAEALSKMAQENVHYPVEKYERHLPKRFAGYLIRSSRRLGMEGLRQRHCVASYHQQVLAGFCAIAAVFVDGTRWTVQLVHTGQEKTPLRIAQIKTRFNGVPSANTMKRIHKILGIKKPKAASEPQVVERPEQVYLDNLRTVLPVLRDLGIQTVTVSFDGSGDSGSIESVVFEPAINASAIRAPVIRFSREWENGRWQVARHTELVAIDSAIDEIVNDYLETTGVDWYNNDGGYGDLVIEVPTGTVELSINTRYTQTNTEHYSKVDIETGEDVV